MPRTIYDKRELGGAERTAERRELVRLWVRSGAHEDRIIQILVDGGYIPPTWEYKGKRALVRSDIRKVQSEDTTKFQSLKLDAEKAWQEYVARQSMLFEKAMEEGNVAVASSISKDIARAYGIPTDEPIRVETNLLDQMKEAIQMGAKRLLEQKQRSIPPPAIEVKVNA